MSNLTKNFRRILDLADDLGMSDQWVIEGLANIRDKCQLVPLPTQRTDKPKQAPKPKGKTNKVIERRKSELHAKGFFTPKEIGERLGISAIEVNLKLLNAGFQTKTRGYKNRIVWQPTEHGKPYAAPYPSSIRYNANNVGCLGFMWQFDLVARLSK